MKASVLVLFTALLLTACASNTTVNEQPPLPRETGGEYMVGVGDQLQIQVWKSPELSVAVPVRPDGKISVPLAGDIVAKGYSAEQLSLEVATKLSNYIRNPQVTVIVTNPASAQYLRRVRVTGAVKAPLSVSHQQGMTVLDLVLQAGGLSEFANGNSAKLYRKSGDQVVAYPVYLKDILEKGKLDSNYVLAPADIITVPEKVF